MVIPQHYWQKYQRRAGRARSYKSVAACVSFKLQSLRVAFVEFNEYALPPFSHSLPAIAGMDELPSARVGGAFMGTRASRAWMNSRKPLIAIVDDDASIRKSLKRLLISSGFHVETFSSGAEFLASAETKLPDAVLLDMYMPDMSGMEVQARFTTAERRVPILFITAHDAPALRAQALARGAAAYLDKPIRKEILLAVIYNALGSGSPTET
jgi:CheY-like chemotaxis protein